MKQKEENNRIQQIQTEKAPKAIGPYSQAVIAGDYMFISGQIGINPKTDQIVKGGIKEETTQVIENIKSILRTQNIGLDKIVKAEVYLTDMKEFNKMNQVYESKFRYKIKPARQAVEVSRLPKDAKIEISVIVYLG